MIVEESQLKGSRFYENLEPDVSPGYTGKLNAGKYIELAGTKILRIPIVNKAKEIGVSILDDIEFTGTRTSSIGPMNDIWNLIHDGNNINFDVITFTINLNTSFSADKLVKVHFDVDRSFVASGSSYSNYGNTLTYTEYDSGFGWKPISIWTGGSHGFSVNLKAGVTKVKFKASTDKPQNMKYYNISAFEINYHDTFVVYYDMTLRTHVQKRVVYSNKYIFNDINVNNIMTMFTKFKSFDIKQLNNEPEAILKTLYGGTPVAGGINIKDLTRYYPVMEDDERVYNVLAKLMGPGFIFRSLNASSKITVTFNDDSVMHSNGMKIDVSAGTVVNVTDNILSDNNVSWIFDEPEKITSIVMGDAWLDGPFPDFSDFVNLNSVSVTNSQLIIGPLDSSLLPANLETLDLTMAKGMNGLFDMRNTLLKKIITRYTHFSGVFGLFPDTIEFYREDGDDFTSVNPDIFVGKTAFTHFSVNNVLDSTINGQMIPEPSDSPLLVKYASLNNRFVGAFPTFDNNPLLEEIEIFEKNILPFPSFTNNLELKKISMSCTTIAEGSPANTPMPDYRHLTKLEEVNISIGDGTSGPFPQFNAPNLKILIIADSRNGLTGGFPDAGIEFPNLESFGISKLSDLFIGGFDSLSNCNKLKTINISGVNLANTIHLNFFDFNDFPELTSVFMQDIYFNGALLPYKITDKVTTIRLLSKSPVGTSGAFPDTSVCVKLRTFRLVNIDLTGDIGPMVCSPDIYYHPDIELYNLEQVTGNIPTYSHITGNGGVKIAACPMITGYAGNGTVPTGNIKSTERDFSNCGLTQVAVDNILKEYALGTSDASLKLYLDNPAIVLPQDPVGTAVHSVGTNAAPSAAGEAAIDTIKARGGTVYVTGTHSPRP